MHLWDDSNVDWDGIDDAARFIGEGLRKYRINVRRYEEKDGTVRVYCTLGVYMFHQLWRPGFVFNQYPFHWIWSLDCFVSYKLRFWYWPNKLWILPLHKKIYRSLYKKAVEKWPHLKEEILCCANYENLLEEF
jgi:hypothetical protein